MDWFIWSFINKNKINTSSFKDDVRLELFYRNLDNLHLYQSLVQASEQMSDAAMLKYKLEVLHFLDGGFGTSSCSKSRSNSYSDIEPNIQESL